MWLNKMYLLWKHVILLPRHSIDELHALVLRVQPISSREHYAVSIKPNNLDSFRTPIITRRHPTAVPHPQELLFWMFPRTLKSWHLQVYCKSLTFLSVLKIVTSSSLFVFHQVFQEIALRINLSKTEPIMWNWNKGRDHTLPESVIRYSYVKLVNNKHFKCHGVWISYKKFNIEKKRKLNMEYVATGIFSLNSTNCYKIKIQKY